jgi:HTH-type transcriptional regulator / antitoxin HigA
VLHRKKELFVDGSLFVDGLKRRPDERTELWQRYEDEPDRFAARTLIPAEFHRELRRLTLGEVQQFADGIGVSPAIVVGRLQHDGRLPYST